MYEGAVLAVSGKSSESQPITKIDDDTIELDKDIEDADI